MSNLLPESLNQKLKAEWQLADAAPKRVFAALIEVIRKNDIEKFKQALALGLDPNFIFQQNDPKPNYSLASLAVLYNAPDILTHLIAECGVKVAEQGADTTPMHQACARGNEQMIEILAKQKGVWLATDKDGMTPLFALLSTKKPERVQALLAKYAINVQSQRYDCPYNNFSVDLLGHLVTIFLSLEFKKMADISQQNNFDEVASEADKQVREIWVAYQKLCKTLLEAGGLNFFRAHQGARSAHEVIKHKRYAKPEYTTDDDHILNSLRALQRAPMAFMELLEQARSEARASKGMFTSEAKHFKELIFKVDRGAVQDKILGKSKPQ